jgi:acetyltransferase
VAKPAVRTLSPADQELGAALGALHLEAIQSGMALGELDGIDPSELERRYCDLIAALDERDRLVFVAALGDEIVGMAQLVFSRAANADHRAEVQRLAVAMQARGAGIGRALMKAVEESARERQITLVHLTTHADTDACAFYESLGYQQLGVMPNYTRRPDGTLWPGAFYYREL